LNKEIQQNKQMKSKQRVADHGEVFTNPQSKHQFSLFNDEGAVGTIGEPVKDYPLIHFLKTW
jgi:hypothetical protein